MIIAIDYDKTFSAAPEFWRAVIALGRVHGAHFVCVTGRSDEGPWGAEVKRGIGGVIPIVFAAGGWKASAAARAGFKVNIWIDDMPEGIRELRAEFAATKRELEAKRATCSVCHHVIETIEDHDGWCVEGLRQIAEGAQ